MSMPNPKADAFLDRQGQWQAELAALRAILLEAGLDEELKWGKPCYSVAGGNVAILQPFKSELRLMFFKGALLDDPKGLLRSQGEQTRSAMMLPFTSTEEIEASASDLRRFLSQAIDNENAGLKVDFVESEMPPTPAELQEAFNEDANFADAFQALTRGRQRYYLIYFGDAKQSGTRRARIEKYKPKIFEGKGFND